MLFTCARLSLNLIMKNSLCTPSDSNKMCPRCQLYPDGLCEEESNFHSKNRSWLFLISKANNSHYWIFSEKNLRLEFHWKFFSGQPKYGPGVDGPLPLQERPLSAGGENEQFDLFETFVFVLIDMISEIMAVCGSLQQHSGEESLRWGCLESQN